MSSEIPSLKNLAIKKVSQTKVLNTMPQSDLKETILKEQRKQKNKKLKDNDAAIQTMNDEIARLKNYIDEAINDDDISFDNIIDDPYEYYFLRFIITTKLLNEEQNMSEALRNSLEQMERSFREFIREDIQETEMNFINRILPNSTVIEECDNDLDAINDLLSATILPDNDQLLKYFIEAYNNNYTKVLISLKHFDNYLAYIAVKKNDADAFYKIKDLYLERDDSYELSLFADNPSLFAEYENELIEQKSLKPNIINELLEKTPRIEGGGIAKDSSYAIILISAIIIVVASIMRH